MGFKWYKKGLALEYYMRKVNINPIIDFNLTLLTPTPEEFAFRNDSPKERQVFIKSMSFMNEMDNGLWKDIEMDQFYFVKFEMW